MGEQMKKFNFFVACMGLMASVCIVACKSTKSNIVATDSVSGATVRADAMPPQGTPPGDGMPSQGGMPPQGPPPGGMGMPPGGQGGRFDESLIKAALMVTEGSMSKNGEEILATEENQSAVAARGDAKVVLEGNKIITSGNTSSQDHSSFQGLNAGVLGRDNAEIRLSGNSITTSGLGANGIFAYGKSVIYSDNDVINCTGGGGHGIMCSGGGTIHASNVNIITSGRNSAPIATDRGSGVITVNGGHIVSHGQDSPGLYSTGKLTISGVDIMSDGSEVAVIEGSNLIHLDSCSLTCSYPNKWGIMIYQSFSGDAEGADGEFEAIGSTIHVTGEGSPLFFVTNSTAYITLDGNDIKCSSGILLNAAASRWGHQGENGGTAVINTRNQTLVGDLQADSYSRIRLHLADNSVLKGAVNADGTAKLTEVHIDKTSRWELPKDCYVSTIEADITEDCVANIYGNGHNIYYDAAQNPSLGGKVYTLQGGGELRAK